MALIRLRPPVVDMRGISNGLIYSYCGKTHTVTPKRAKKPAKKTARTEQRETIIRKLARMWNGQLTEEQRTVWNNYAKSIWATSENLREFGERNPVFGKKRSYITGYGAFVKVNVKLDNAGYSSIYLPPPKNSPYVRLSWPSKTILYTPYRIKIDWTETATPVAVSNYRIAVYVRKHPHGTWYRIGTMEKNIGTYTITEYRGTNGNNIALTKGMYQIKLVSTTLQGESFVHTNFTYANIQ